MTKTTLVRTDDPAMKVFSLVVKGVVEKIVNISPEAVYLTGKKGDTLEAAVTLVPSEKYPFSILGMEKKHNSRIEALLEAVPGDQKSWQIKIKCVSDKVADLYDELVLKTDSPYKPTVNIKVSAMFLESTGSSN
jgi:hypothetical protein